MIETSRISLHITVQNVASRSFRIVIFYAEALFVFHIEENLFWHVIPGVNLAFQEVPKKVYLIKLKYESFSPHFIQLVILCLLHNSVLLSKKSVTDIWLNFFSCNFFAWGIQSTIYITSGTEIASLDDPVLFRMWIYETTNKSKSVLFKCLAQVKNNYVRNELKYIIFSPFVPLFIEKETMEH